MNIHNIPIDYPIEVSGISYFDALVDEESAYKVAGAEQHLPQGGKSDIDDRGRMFYR
jgi:hypothetical protein